MYSNKMQGEAKTNEFEKYLASYLIPLPIDQRYRQDDMVYIAEIIMRVLQG